MDYKKYVHQLVQSFRDNSTSNYMFIKHYDTLLVPEKELYHVVADETSGLCLLFHVFPLHTMQGPYAPFLDWIRELYYSYFRNETPKEFLEHAGVYRLLQPCFESYIVCGVAERTEDLLENEFTFEKEQMLLSITNIYNYIAKKRPIFIFLEKMHLANKSCIKLLYNWVKKNELKNVQIFGLYNELYKPVDYLKASWRKLIDEVERQDLQYEWTGVTTETTIDVQDVFIPHREQMPAHIETASNLYYFLAIDDARYYLEILYAYAQKKKECQEKVILCVQMLKIYTLVLLLDKNTTEAMQVCARIGDIWKRTKEDGILYTYNFLSAMCQFGTEKMGNKVDAYVDKCIEIAKRTGSDLDVYKAEVLRLISNYNYWRDVFENCDHFYISDEFLQKTKKYGFDNLLAYIYVYSFDGSEEVVRSVIDGKGEQKYFNEGVAIAERLKNYHFLVSAYTKNIVLFSQYGCHQIVEKMYKKKLQILEISGANPIRLLHTYNGLGYNASMAEKYTKAEEYFQNSLEACLEIEDGEEVAVTLYNSAINKILAREYTMAAKDLKLLLQIMEMLHMYTMNVCDISRVYGMLGFCSLYTKEEYTCYLCMNRIEVYVRHLKYIEGEEKYNYWHSTLFWFRILRASLYCKEKRYKEAEMEFEKADFHQKADLGNRIVNYTIYVTELANFYEKIGREEERNAILEKSISVCKKQGYHLREEYFLNMLHKQTTMKKNSYHFQRVISDRFILDKIQNLATKKNLAINQKHIDFMVAWQELLNRNLSYEEMVGRAIFMMKNYFDLDGVCLLRRNKDCEIQMEFFDGPQSNGVDTCVTDCVRSMSEKEYEKIFKYFKLDNNAILTNRIDKGFLEYKKLLKLFDIHHLITLYAFPYVAQNGEVESVLVGYVEMRNDYLSSRHLLQNQDFKIMKYFTNQLYVALERIQSMQLINRMNSQLRDMAVTDLLTGLYNRQGFEKRLEEDSHKASQENCFVYVDLDNFKYYNDTFGHGIGDFVLVRFAQLLERVVEGLGYAVRYGGDEFVLVLEDYSLSDTKRLAKNIGFMMRHNFTETVEQRIGKKHKIPADKYLTCSIGIASCKGFDGDTVGEALNKADKALYYVKKTTKHDCAVWDELPEAYQ